MLSPDLVRVRRQGKELVVVKLAARSRERALELSAILLEQAREHVGRTREELDEAIDTLTAGLAERKLALGLAKVLEDASEFSLEAEMDPVELRSRLFVEASAEWRATVAGDRFDRNGVLARVGAERDLEVEHVERLLYADLKSAQKLLSVETLTPEALVERYEQAALQAVLLRAVRLTATIRCSTASSYRALFHKLKFRRLLYQIEPLSDGRYELRIDGPYSLFDSVTKYGLSLSLVLPSLLACDELELRAEVRWGKLRQALTFALSQRGSGHIDAGEPRLPDEVGQLLQAFSALASPWRAEPADAILDLPGVGLCIPDLVFRNAESGAHIYLEVMGFWSRQAVWRRVELVEHGLPEPILFAVSSRLRVSEAVIDDQSSSALYVYKGTMSARGIQRKLDELAARTPKATKKPRARRRTS